jgi:PKD repeat protein
MKSITQNNSSYLGYPNGLKTDNPLNFNQLKLYRRFLYDGLYNITNISQNIDNAANLSVNGNHYWYSDFTHRVGFQQINGCLVFPTLEFYMNYIADTYGKNGTDRVWMAGYQDVYEYLAVRDYSILRWNLNQNQLQIIIERTNIPTDLEKYALSLVIDANANIINVSSENITGITWNNKAKKIINLDWTPTALENITFDNGAGVTKLKKAQILNPVADFIYAPTAPYMDQQVSFANNSLMQNISSYAWDIGNDGIIDYTTKDIIHAFSLAGSYPVKLTVSNGTTSLDVTKTVTVTYVVNDIIIDDADGAPRFTLVGTWNNSSVSSGRYGPTSKVPASATNTNAKAIFTPNILVPGVYQIFESHAYNSNRENAAPFTITHRNGSSLVKVNQQSAATSFSVSLGEFEFNAGTTGFVTLTEISGSNWVNADALKFVYKGPLPATSLKSITDFNGRKNESINISDNGLKFGSLLNVTNYPNPFSTSTTIYWQALASEQTTLEVTDVFGRKIKTLVNEFKSQGEHTVRFDSEALSEGIYFYQLKLGNSIVTKKMMIKK